MWLANSSLAIWLQRGKGSRANPDGDPSGREKLYADLEEYQPLPISLPRVSRKVGGI